MMMTTMMIKTITTTTTNSYCKSDRQNLWNKKNYSENVQYQQVQINMKDIVLR